MLTDEELKPIHTILYCRGGAEASETVVIVVRKMIVRAAAAATVAVVPVVVVVVAVSRSTGSVTPRLLLTYFPCPFLPFYFLLRFAPSTCTVV